MTVLAVVESTLPSFGMSCQIQHNEATVAVSAVMVVSLMTDPRAQLHYTHSELFSELIRISITLTFTLFNCLGTHF